MQFTVLPTLDDAEYFLVSSRGLPLTLTGRPRAAIYQRAVVIYSWIAVEQAVKETLKERPNSIGSRRLWDQISSILRGKYLPPERWEQKHLMRSEFQLQRRLRNRVTHSLSNADDGAVVAITLDQAGSCFNYCRALIDEVLTYPLLTSGWSRSGLSNF